MVSDKFIKNFAVSLTLVFVLSVAGFAADYVTTKLNEIEKNYYGYVTKGTVQTRLSRIERSLYGMNYKTADKTRVDKIYKDLNLGLNNSGPTGGAASAKQTQDSQRADIGPKAETEFAKVIAESKTILWNGPVGVFEIDKFAKGSKAIAEAIVKATKNGAFSLIGGGDSVACINKFGMADQVSYVSTGGGALLEYMEGIELPGVAAIRK